VLADGPLPALALSALKGPTQDTIYAATGGVWTDAADATAHALIAKRQITMVVLTFAENEHGRRSRELATASFAAAAPWVTLEEWFPCGHD